MSLRRRGYLTEGVIKGVYRGTSYRAGPIDIKKLRRGEYGWGVYFTDNFNLAAKFGPKIVTADLALQKPFKTFQFSIVDDIEKATGKRVTGVGEKSAKEITRVLEQAGYDGLVVKVGKDKYYCVFNPKAIRIHKAGPPPKMRKGKSMGGTVGKSEKAF